MESAKVFFNEVRQAAINMQRCEQELAQLVDQYSAKTQHYDSIGSGGTGIPLSLQERYLAAKERTISSIAKWSDLVDEGVELAAHVTDLLGNNCYEYALLHYYCDAMEWREVGRMMYVSYRTAQRWADTALDTIDSLGLAHVRAGIGIAEK